MLVKFNSNATIEEIRLNSDDPLNWIESKKACGQLFGKNIVKVCAEKCENGAKAEYNIGQLKVKYNATFNDQTLVLDYEFENTSDKACVISKNSLGVYLPFNDSYIYAAECLTKRCHAHIFRGHNSSYIYGLRMNGQDNNLAVVTSVGSVGGYSVERAWNSNDRGDFAFLLEEQEIAPHDKVVLQFTFFEYLNVDDFFAKAKGFENYLEVKSSKYTYTVKDTAIISIDNPFKKQIAINGEKIGNDAKIEYKYACSKLGENKVEISYDDKKTHIIFFVVEDYKKCLKQRFDFIIDKQQCNDNNKYNGAYLLYDNDEQKQFVSDASFNDHTAGRERAGMSNGIMAYLLNYGNKEKDYDRMKQSVHRAVEFSINNLIGKNGKVYDNATYRGWLFHERPYNAPWYVLQLTLASRLFDNAEYLKIAMSSIRRYYARGGTKFYCINMPMCLYVDSAKKFGLNDLAKEAKNLFLAHGDSLVEIGLRYPSHEVKYEQSIVAPSVDILLECYLLSRDNKYLDEAKKQLVVLNAFNGRQPDFHQNEISIRHWDGFWFGKKKLYGDTFPHYWSCITAMVFSKYAMITKDKTYAEKCDVCTDNNLILIKDGKGSCAYIYPDLINGMEGDFAESWANDQDWLAFFQVMYNSRYGLYSKLIDFDNI